MSIEPETVRLASVNLNQPLSDPELQELGDFLDSESVPFDTMDIFTLDGFLTTIAIVPDFVSPGEWIPQIFGELGEPRFGSLEQQNLLL